MRFISFVSLLSLLCLGTAEASLVQVTFSGTINTINDPGNVLAGVIEIGQPYTVHYRFDTTAQDNWSGPNFALYYGTTSELILPNITASGTASLALGTQTPSFAFRGDSSNWGFMVYAYPTTALTSDTFPWPFPQMTTDPMSIFLEGTKTAAGGPVDSVDVTELPEPSHGMVLLAAMYFLRRRRSL